MEEIKKKRGRPPKPKVETQSELSAINENNSYYSRISVASGLLGCDIFDEYDEDELKDMLSDPMANNQQLRELSRKLYNSSGIITNVIDYSVSLPTLDYIIVPHGDDKAKRKSNRKLAKSVIDKIRHKEIIRDGLFSNLIDGAYYAYLEVLERPNDASKTLSDYEVQTIVEINTDKKVVAAVITLPVDACKIVGYKYDVPIVAFDLTYFNVNGNEPTEKKLRRFPKEIRDGYAAYNSAGSSKNNWLILSTDHTIATKYRAKRIEPFGRPLCLGAIANALYASEYLSTKRTVLNDLRNQVYYQTFPESDKKGISSLSKTQQENQHNAVRNGLQGKGAVNSISFFSVASGTKIDKVKTDSIELLDNKYESTLRDDIAADLGFAGSLLSGSAPNASYASLNMNVQLISGQIFAVVDLLTSELNKVINAQFIQDANNSVQIQYLPITFLNRKEVIASHKDLYLQGKGSLLMWAAASGIEAETFLDLVKLEEDLELESLPVHQTSFTLSAGQANAGGRPPVEDVTNASTASTRKNNANAQPKPSTK